MTSCVFPYGEITPKEMQTYSTGTCIGTSANTATWLGYKLRSSGDPNETRMNICAPEERTA